MLIQPIIACQDFDLEKLFLLLLTLSISAVHLRLQPDRFHPNLLSVCSAALFLLNMNRLCLPWRSRLCFHRSRTGPKLLGAT